VVERVTMVNMTFFIAVEGGVEWFGEGSRRWRCGFNASVFARERRQRDEALLEDEVKVAS
jgi:hypothetical protein